MRSVPPRRRTTLVTACLDRTVRLGKPGRILSPKVDLVRSVGPLATRMWRDEADDELWARQARLRLYEQIWAGAAAAVGGTLEPFHEEGYWSIRRGGAHTIVRDHYVMLDNAIRHRLALDKGLVQRLLGEAGVPVPVNVEVDADAPGAALEFMAEVGGPSVVKPANGTAGGDGVTCGVETDEQFHRARIWARRWDWRVLVEAQAQGDEYRFLFLDGRCLDVVRRRPPRLVGDGRSTVMQLLEAENQRRRDGDGAIAIGPITVRLDTLFALQRAGLRLTSVPSAGETFAASAVANPGSADDGVPIPLSEVSEALLAQIGAAARVFDLRFAGVDVVTPDLSRPLGDAGGVVLEVNGTPGLHYHYLVSDRSRAARVAIPVLAALLDVETPPGWRADEPRETSR